MSEDLDDIVENLREPSAWARIVFMLGFSIVLYMVVIPLTLLLTLAQALFSVFTGEDNDNLRDFGASLLAYISQVVRFLTFNSEERPFPFSDFPEWGGASEGEGEKTKTKTTAKESKTKPAAENSTAGSEPAAADKPAVKKAAKRKSSSKKTTKKVAKKAKKKSTKASSDQAAKADKADAKAGSDEPKE